MWDGDLTPSAWSEPAAFAVGLLSAEDWQALWISAPKDKSFTKHADKVAKAFRKIYLKPDGSLAIHNQSAYAMALFFGLIPDAQTASAANHLAKLVKDNGNKMTTGFLGTRPLLPALSAHGHHDLAGILMRQREFPSWGYEVDNGATTIGSGSYQFSTPL